jgi:Domain of unknown function (DUF4124)
MLGLACGPLALGAAPTIYSCVDSQGRRLSSDRPIAECLDRPQRLHNGDGSVRALAPPSLSPEEQARQDLLRERAAQDEAVRAAAVRRDRSLLVLYPTEAAHAAARARTLAPVQSQIDDARNRLAALQAEAAGLAQGPERTGPVSTQASRQARLAAIAGASAAQRELVRDRSEELNRLTRRLDEELATLRLLWAGVPPGTGRLPVRAAGSTPAP